MSDGDVRDLAREAGLALEWTDAFGAVQHVELDVLRHVLRALDYPCDSAGDIAEARRRLAPSGRLPPMVTADVGGTLSHTAVTAGARWKLRLEDGATVDGRVGETLLPEQAGYHVLSIGDDECVLALAPRVGHTIRDALRGVGKDRERAWGLAAQLYSLRRAGDGGLGDLAALTALADSAGRHGADALSISPLHAQFSADPERFSPYAPSSRVLRNVLHAAVDVEGPDAASLEAAELVDWPRAGRLRMRALRAEWERSGRGDPSFAAWRRDCDEAVELHARFETLHAHHFDGGRGPWHWRDWPQEHRNFQSDAVRSFAEEHRDTVDFHAWLQFRVESGLELAQATARRAGMAIGLVADLAVGVDGGGSHCWSRPDETLLGLTVGAPPDLLSRDGQNWGITAFSPRGLREYGFRAFVEMLRAAMRGAGGVRIDHAMGLNRLWIVPEGEKASRGTYIAMPERDLLRLLRLESRRERSVVLAEDLGTVPEGFSDRLRAAGIDGMEVLWFARGDHGRFLRPSEWPERASAMTSTHDLATVSGWWRGRDIEWNERLGRNTEGAEAERARDRGALWHAFVDAGVADGDAPADWDGRRVTDAAVGFLGGTRSEFVMLPLEDALALPEAPNLPGTTDEHPNWRRRLPGDAADLLDTDHVRDRLRRLDAARRTPSAS